MAYTHQQKQEIRSCYHEYSPAQIAKAGEMMAAGRNCEALKHATRGWKRIGVSNGGKTRANLYLCRAVVLAGIQAGNL